MSDPAVLAAVITGAVAFVAIVGTLVTTGLTLRHQRIAEDQRRKHERQMRLLDSGLKAAVDFLAAADRTTRAKQALDVATTSLDGAKSSGDEQVRQHYRDKYEEAREQTVAAWTDAENAYTAVRMLIPSVSDQARRYLDFCQKADFHPDTGKAKREQTRQEVEKMLRQAFGGGQQAQESVRRRWWKITGRSRAPGIEAPRQP